MGLDAQDLAREALDISGGSDSLWFIDPGTGRVVPADSSLLSSLAQGRLRV